MADAAEKQERAEYPNEDYMFAGADPVENEDLGGYDPDDQQEVSDDVDEDTLTVEPTDKTGESEGTEETSDEAVAEEPAANTEAEAESEEAEDDVQPDTAEADAEQEESEPERGEEKATENIQIPKWRLDREIAKRRKLEQELAETRKRAPVDSVTGDQPSLTLDVSELEREYADMLLDGKTDRAAEIRAQINNKIAQESYKAAIKDIDMKVDQRVSQQSSQSELDRVINDLENQYDFLRDGSETFDQDLVEEIGAFYNGYASQGFTPAQAMQKAADNALKLYKPELFETKAPPEQERGNLRDVASTKQQKRSEVKRNVEAAQKQPPELPRSEATNNRYEDTNPMELSEEEFEALPEAVKRRARGDYL